MLVNGTLMAAAVRRPVTSPPDDGRCDAAIAPQLPLKSRLRLGQPSRVNTRENRCQQARISAEIVNARNLTSVSSIFEPNNVSTKFHHFMVTFLVWEL
jgi:hypothetical protein